MAMNLLVEDDEPRGFTVYWRIENFNCEPPCNYNLKSEIFSIEKMFSCWQLSVDVNNGFMGAFIQKKQNPVQFLVHYSISLLSSSGWIIRHIGQEKFRNNGRYGGVYFVDITSLIEKQWFYLPNGSCTVRFHLWNDHTTELLSTQCLMISRLRVDNYSLRHKPKQFFSDLKSEELLFFPSSYDFRPKTNPGHTTGDLKAIEIKSQTTQTEENINCDGVQELLKLFNEMKFSFVTLRTPDKDFSVHKAILCAKSPVFKAMFEAQMKESFSNVVEVDDIGSQTVAALVNFLHFEPLGDLDESTMMDLYYAADKYQIDSLKEKCVSLLKEGLSVENICVALHMADLYQDSDLMTYAQEYFCKNSKAILLTKQWKNMLCRTELVADLLCKLAETML